VKEGIAKESKKEEEQNIKREMEREKALHSVVIGW
jgi:hypothetical protein